MRTPLKNRVVLGVVLAALVFAATHNIRAELPQAIGSWASLGTTPESRVGAAAAILKDGRTVIAGGSVDGTPTDSVVVFDPNTGSFSLAGHLLLARVGHTATLLDDGRILIAGGTAGDLVSADLELFDPASGVSVIGGAMTQPRSGHAAAKLADGKVLIVGGSGVDGVLQTAELYDPETGATSLTTLPMLSPRTGASATTLIDGRVLVAGGFNGNADLKTAEIFEPSSQIFEATTTTLSYERSGHAAVLLPNNNSVLIAGGSHDNVPVPTSDLFVPAEFPDPYSYGMGSFAQTGDLVTPRARAIASPHIEGYAVTMGGGAPEAEVYRFPTIKTDKDDYAPGEMAVITGSGWEPNADVRLLFQEDPAVHDDYVVHVTSDSEGNVYWDQWAPEHHDIGVQFYLLASDSRSRAQVTFTDGPKVGSVSVGTQSPDPVTAGNNATYTITVNRGSGPGSPGAFTATLSLTTALPAGATASFSPNPVSFASGDASKTATLTISTTAATPGGSTPLSVKAATSAADFATNNGTLAVVAASLNTTTTASSTTATFGDASVTLNAAVTPASGPAVGVGTVTFTVKNGGTTIGSVTSGTVTAGAASASFPLTAVNAGTYTVEAAYSGGTGFNASNNSAQSPAPTLTVSEAPTTTTVTCDAGPFAYTGVAQTPCTATVTGAGSLNQSLTVNYSNNLNAGTATASANFAATSNYLASSDSETFTIGKAGATVVVTAYTADYDGQPHMATYSITGVNGESGATVGTVDVSGTTHTDAGTYDDSWSFTGTANYNDIAPTSITDTIHKVDATVVVTPYSVTYDGHAHTATGTATGVNADDLTGLLDLSGTTHTDAGTYNGDTWTFAGNTNYNPANGTVDDAIAKANATIVVTPYSVTYDGNAHTATGTATGVNADDLTGLLDLSGTTHTAAGTYNGDAWTFAGNTNYNTANGTVDDAIAKANANITVNGYTGVYDGGAHGATGTAVGVMGESLSGLTLGVSFTNVPGGTANWAFADSTGNYNDANGSVQIVISKANATISVTEYHVIYDGLPHTATGSATGVLNENLSGLDLSATTRTAPGIFSDPWTFTDVTGNYNSASGTAHDSISFASSGMCLGEPGHKILQPINADGTSVVKRNSTVPAKFRVCDAAGNSVGIAGVVQSFRLISIVNGTATQDTNESVTSTTPDVVFRWDPIGNLWIFNINTKGLDLNKTYVYRITLSDLSTIDFQFGVR